MTKTLLNQLPIVVSHKGEYITRDGRKVLINEVKPQGDLGTTSFNCKGNLITVSDTGRERREYNIWHESGRSSVYSELGCDIVGVWNEN